MGRPRSWTDEQLIEAVAASETLLEVLERLGLKRGGGTLWSDADLAQAVATSFSMAQTIAAMGLRVGGSVYPMLREHITRLGLDTSHWTGNGRPRGSTFPGRNGRPLADVLVADSDYRNTDRLKKRLLRAGLKEPRCEICGLAEWRDAPIPLQLDHVNGVRSDNRLENLRILCPNCHAQTETWCGRNIGNGRGTVSDR
ncbi:MAG TPA: HNH endonuclease signature motif containing protein [Egibacteraceae bacterium]|nr:HNH endonuclease signature motif containing protein [Egibacteraceae bacterium]